MRKVCAILLLAVLATAADGPRLEAQSKDGKDRRVVIVNPRSSPLMRLYGARASISDWEENILTQPIPPGSRIVVNFDDGTGACLFDFRAVFQDREMAHKWGVNVCTESMWVAE